METFKRICIEDQVITDGENTLELKRGQEYLTSPEKDGMVHLFSRYWVWVPKSWFAGEIEFTSA